mgnify:CR=1 FL=1
MPRCVVAEEIGNCDNGKSVQVLGSEGSRAMACVDGIDTTSEAQGVSDFMNGHSYKVLKARPDTVGLIIIPVKGGIKSDTCVVTRAVGANEAKSFCVGSVDVVELVVVGIVL